MQLESPYRFNQTEVLRDLGRRHSCPNTLAGMVAKAVHAVIVVIALYGAVPLSRATTQTNDLCTGAEVVRPDAGASSPFYTSAKDISMATTTGDPVAPCQEFVARSLWYSFTPNTNAIYTIAACNDPIAPTATTVSDTVMAIYRSAAGCGGPFSVEDCSDDACGPQGLQSSITRPLLAGTTYYIVVWQYYDPLAPPTSSGVLQLRVTRSIPPPNDTCATATPVPLNFPVVGTTVGAANNYQLAAASGCFTGAGQVPSTAPGPDVVYSFVAPRAGDYNFKVYNHGVQDNLVVYVAGMCPASGAPAIVTSCLGAANRSSASSAEEVVCVSLAANQRVFVFVDEHAATAGSSFSFEVNQCYREREPNNTWTNASYLACGMVGSMQPGTDVDYYFLGNPQAGSRAFLLVDGESASTTDFDLRLTTSSETLEYDDQDNDVAFGSFSPNIAGAILPGRTAYARVDFRGSATEPYHIYAVVQPPMSAAAAEIEPNDSAGEATLDERYYYRGALTAPGPSTDVDVFMFAAEASQLVFVSLDGDPLRDGTPISAKLELIDEFGSILTTVDDGNATSVTNSGVGTLTAVTPRSPGEAFVYRVVNDGTYFARVTISPGTTGPAGAGDYLLSISKTWYTAPARFRTWVRLGSGAVTLRLEGTPAARYHLEYSSDLKTWTPLPPVYADNAGVIQVEDASAAGVPQRFYRAVAP